MPLYCISSPHPPFSLQHRLIAKPPHGSDLKSVTDGKFIPQLCDINVHGPQARPRVRLPELIHQLRAGKNLIGIREQLIQDIELPCGHRNFFTVYHSAHGIRIQCQVSYGYFSPHLNIRPPKQRTHPEQHFFKLNRLYHVIVNPKQKAPLFGRQIVFRGHEQNRDIFIYLADIFRKFKAVHLRHHNIRNDQVKKSIVHFCSCQVRDKKFS